MFSVEGGNGGLSLFGVDARCPYLCWSRNNFETILKQIVDVLCVVENNFDLVCSFFTCWLIFGVVSKCVVTMVVQICVVVCPRCEVDRTKGL